MKFGELYFDGARDNPDLGPVAVICMHGIDGNLADVYGETVEEAEAAAKRLVQLVNFLEGELRYGIEVNLPTLQTIGLWFVGLVDSLEYLELMDSIDARGGDADGVRFMREQVLATLRPYISGKIQEAERCPVCGARPGEPCDENE
jgi:hypothetical protein